MKYLLQCITVQDGEFNPEVASVETIDIINTDYDTARNKVRDTAFAKLEPMPRRTMLWIQHGGAVTMGKVSTANMEIPYHRTAMEYYTITELVEPKG